jgi:hypothetical protein
MIRTLSAFVLLFYGSSAHALSLTGFGGLNYAAPTDIRSGSEQHWTGDAASIFGFSVDIPFSVGPFSFETGLFLKSSKSEHTVNGVTGTTANTWTDIPLLVHFHFDERISFGLGGYWSFLRSADAANPATSPDSGLILDLRARIPISENFSFVLDGRYIHGLNNLATLTGNTLNTRSVQALLGVAYDLNFAPVPNHQQ